jgi:type IV pilus assembly protein PilV
MPMSLRPTCPPLTPSISAARVRQRGASLIEVLVSMFIASVGILALAGLLGTATRYAKTAEYRAVATLLAADMADRLRANRAGEAVYSLVNTTLNTAGGEAVTCANPAACTFTELANQDMAAWDRSLYNSLPSGTGYIQRSSSTDHMFDIWVIWEEPDALSGAAYGNAADSTRASTAGCPTDFSISDKVPRCMFFRVGL